MCPIQIKTCLTEACAYGHTNIVQFLVEDVGITKDSVCQSIERLLSVNVDQTDILEYLVDHYNLTFDNLTCEDKYRIVNTLFRNERIDEIRILKNLLILRLDHILSDNSLVLEDIIRRSNLKMFEILVYDFGLNKYYIQDQRFPENDYYNILSYASSNGNIDMIKFLKEQVGMIITSSIDEQECFDPIYFAAYKGHLDIVKYFIYQCRISIDYLRRYISHFEDEEVIKFINTFNYSQEQLYTLELIRIIVSENHLEQSVMII